MCNMAGSANEIVLPLPVWAIATTSRPLSAIGQAWHWIGVGAGKPCARMEVMRYSGNPTSSKAVTGLGMLRPCTFWNEQSAQAHKIWRLAHFHFLTTAKLLDLPFAASSDAFIFDVEILLKVRYFRRWPVYRLESTTQVGHPVAPTTTPASTTVSAAVATSAITITVTLLIVKNRKYTIVQSDLPFYKRMGLNWRIRVRSW